MPIEQCQDCYEDKADTECVILKVDWPYCLDLCADCRPERLAGHVEGLKVKISGEWLAFEDLTFEAQSEILGDGMLTQEFKELIAACIKDISDDPNYDIEEEDEWCNGLDLTIGYTPAKEDGTPHSWGFQTGDNSFTGGAYLHPHWAVTTLYRECDANEVAKEMREQIAELMCH